MTAAALLATIALLLLAVPVVALAAMVWNAIPTAGLGDVFPDERLLQAIRGADAVAVAQTGSPGLWS